MHQLYAEATMVYIIFIYDFYEQKIFTWFVTVAKLLRLLFTHERISQNLKKIRDPQTVHKSSSFFYTKLKTDDFFCTRWDLIWMKTFARFKVIKRHSGTRIKLGSSTSVQFTV